MNFANFQAIFINKNNRFIKSRLDRAAAAIFSILLSLMILLAAIAIDAQIGSPIFWVQELPGHVCNCCLQRL